MRKKIIITLIILTICAVIYFIMPHINSLLFLKITYERKKATYMYVTPININITNNEKANKGYTYNIFDKIDLEIPCQALMDNDYHKNDVIKIIRCPNNKTIMFDNSNLINPEIKRQISEINKSRRNEILNSDFETCARILEVTPDKLSIFSSMKDKREIVALLILKESILPRKDIDGIIYKFTTNRINGFVFDFKKDTQTVILFDKNKNYVLKIIFNLFSESEISEILSSIHSKPKGDNWGRTEPPPV